MKINIVLAMLIFPSSVVAVEMSPAEWHETTWVCITEAVGGISFDQLTEEWVGQGFLNRESFIVSGKPSYSEDAAKRYWSYEIRYVGKDKGILCFASDLTTGNKLKCDGVSLSFELNSATKRFMVIHSGQYLASRSSYAELTPEEKRIHNQIVPLVDGMNDDLAIAIGKCNLL